MSSSGICNSGMSNSEYGVFIITRGRPNNQITYETLRRCGYSGKIYFVLDSDDTTIPEYIDRFGKESILIIDKMSCYSETDTCLNGMNTHTAVLTRNCAVKLANRMGYKYLFQCDDDIEKLYYRLVVDGKLITRKVRSLDKILPMLIELYVLSHSKILGIIEDWRYFGGIKSQYAKKGFISHATNFFVTATDITWNWRGYYYDDVIMAVSCNPVGELVWSTSMLSFYSPAPDETRVGGQTENYSANKSYYAPYMMIFTQAPSIVRLLNGTNTNGDFRLQLHENAKMPKILNSTWRKSVTDDAR